MPASRRNPHAAHLAWRPAMTRSTHAFMHASGLWVLLHIDRAIPKKPGWYVWGPTASQVLIAEQAAPPFEEANAYCEQAVQGAQAASAAADKARLDRCRLDRLDGDLRRA